MKKNYDIKNFVLDFGDNFIKITTFILLLLVIICSFITLSEDFLGGLIVLLIGIISVSLFSWLTFCIIDIRNSLQEISKNTRCAKNDIEIESEDLSNNEKFCSNCGKKIKIDAVKCKYCDYWFNEKEQDSI